MVQAIKEYKRYIEDKIKNIDNLLEKFKREKKHAEEVLIGCEETFDDMIRTMNGFDYVVLKEAHNHCVAAAKVVGDFNVEIERLAVVRQSYMAMMPE